MNNCRVPLVEHSARRNFAWAILVFVLLFLLPKVVAGQWTTNGDDINNTNSGNVGVGTTAPEPPGSNVKVVDVRGSSGGGLTFGTSSGAKAYLYRWIDTHTYLDYSGADFVFLSNAERMRLTNNGNLGVGTAAPVSLLNLVGTNATLTFGAAFASDSSSFNVVVAASGSATNGGNGRHLSLKAGDSDNTAGRTGGNLILNPGAPTSPATAYGNVLVATAGGSFGVGTTNPAQAFEVKSGGGTRARITIANDQSGGAEFYSSGGTFKGGLLYYSPLNITSLYGPDSGASAIDITSSSNVGIGTTTPATKLHVVGDVTVTGNIAAKYQDIAEWVPSSSIIPAGTVVVLDSSKSNQVIASTQAYDTRVAGVISAQPGLTLGEAGEDKVLVATTGRVRVKVDATAGPIQVGDLLVTSDKEGLAMKSLPVDLGGVKIHRPGTLIGKALEPLGKGIGEILVLLSLQ